MSNWISRAKERAHKLETYTRELETAHQEALEELASIAAGFTLTDQSNAWSLSTKLQDRAARFLARRKIPNKNQKPGWIF